jgi:excisionase family DNA binding protein
MGRKLLTTDEAAERLRRPPETVRYWRHIGEGPPAAKIGRRVFYDEAELDAWIDSHFAAKQSADATNAGPNNRRSPKSESASDVSSP